MNDTAIAPPGIGDNNPPDALTIFTLDLAERTESWAKRAADLAVGAAKVPDAIEDVPTAKAWTDFTKQCRDFYADLEQARVGEKRPIDAMGKAVQDRFKGIAGVLDRPFNALVVRLKEYKDAADAAAKRAADAARKQAAAEAEAKAAAAAELERQAHDAARNSTAATRGEARQLTLDAAAANQAAEQAGRVAILPTRVQPTRIRGDYSTGYTRDHWTFEVTHPAEVPRLYLDVNEQAVRAALHAATKAGNPPPPIPGIRWIKQSHFAVR